MREIKFRGKRIDNGELVHGIPLVMDTGNAYIIADGQVNAEAPHGWVSSIRALHLFDVFEVDPATVGQHTGLKDKNGKEIYEGDILRVVNNPLVDDTPYCVCWSEELAGWCWKDKDGEDEWDYGIAKTSVIIGNIHDNPELLKED